MRPPIFVRSLSDTEKEQLQTALRSKDAFVMRRAQIILASNRDERASTIARALWDAPPRRCAMPSTTSTSVAWVLWWLALLAPRELAPLSMSKAPRP